MRQFLEFGQGANHPEEIRDVGPGRVPDIEGCFGHALVENTECSARLQFTSPGVVRTTSERAAPDRRLTDGTPQGKGPSPLVRYKSFTRTAPSRDGSEIATNAPPSTQQKCFFVAAEICAGLISCCMPQRERLSFRVAAQFSLRRTHVENEEKKAVARRAQRAERGCGRRLGGAAGLRTAGRRFRDAAGEPGR